MITHFINLDIYHALTTRANKEVIDGKDLQAHRIADEAADASITQTVRVACATAFC
jgi:hypothetical protein